MSAPNSKEEAPRLSLPVEIRAATRNQHTALNRLIRSRLPLCLPPHADRPYLYTLGIANLGQIYVGFEDSLRGCLETGEEDGDLRVILSSLSISGLKRTWRLEADLQRMKSRDISPIGPTLVAPAWDQRVKQNIRSKPHVVMAYQWVMYMALFNGGRWIQSELVSAGPSFWNDRSAPAGQGDEDKIDCLSFWHFPGDQDGDELKDEFESRFNEAALQLDDHRRRDVVDEAVRIFELCLEIVQWLDAAAVPQPCVVLGWARLPSWPVLRLAAVPTMLVSLWQRLSKPFASWRRPPYPGLVRQDSHSD